MAGALTQRSFRGQDKIENFRETLGLEGAKHLVSEYLYSIKFIPRLSSLIRTNTFPSQEETEMLARKVLCLRGSKAQLEKFNYIQGELDPLYYSKIALLRTRRLVYLPKLKVVNGKSPCAKVAIIRKSKTLELRNGIFTSGSEAIQVENKWLVDKATYPQSKSDNYISDSLLLGKVRLKIAMRNEAKPSITLKKVIFLAYPLTSSWGHWVIEALTRLAQLDKAINLREYEIIICDDVPENFLDVAREIFGALTFTRVERGQSIKANVALVELSTHHQKHRFFGSKNGGATSYLDSHSFQLLRDRLNTEKVTSIFSGDTKLSKVYLDRTNSSYRRNESELEIKKITDTSGYVAVDPGTLSAKEELRLFSEAQEVTGFYGSQALLLFASKDLNKAIFIYHDFLDEARSFSQMIKKVTGVTPVWVCGSRKNSTNVYSENSIHQAIMLDAKELEDLRGLL